MNNNYSSLLLFMLQFTKQGIQIQKLIMTMHLRSSY